MIEFKMKKIGKTALAMVLAGTFVFSPVLASANSLSEQEEKNAEEIIKTDDAETVKVSEDTEKPSLVPGDFFYFVKIALEKIKLAITFDNEKEAELLAAYAAERLAEAEELFNAGDEERAVETIKNAIAYLNDYDKKAEDETDKDEEPVVEEETEQPTDEEKPADNVQAEDENVEGQEPAEEEQVVEEDKNETDSDKVVRQNIVALKAALEKVKNPTAKAALQKNIDKTYAKIAEKLGKIDSLEPKEEDKAEVVTKEETPVTEEETTVTEPVTPVTDEEETVEEEKPAVAVPVAPKKQEAKVEKKAVKEVRKQEQQKAKEVRKEQKQAVKEVRKAAKAEAKQAKLENKEKKSNGKSAPNGNKNGNKGNNGNKGGQKQSNKH
ncbi:hypothetical protein D1B31_22430 [Neobacillus notoginsengisoli]|uniref:DUF5667 domain-containing protein n=1 Tax=Neobacillus notoginsengisoli TaxID=1578198 RepID=A0A417YFI6_9BACI|nr:DUF5667 domain-containing protein [Neobacillus notoginsengisoli]RHW31435.1 hypothetical protein D1B31_22430 [Neobacillus notoginsengisoli]